MNFQITEYCHHILEEYIEEGDICIDATAGNGGDTEFLCKKVGETGNVYAFDVQEMAISHTRERLERANLSTRAKLIHDGHEKMQTYVKEEVKAIIFNFGYLPGSDHKIATHPSTSLAAIESALNLLKKGGIINLCIYSGGGTGYEEKEAILNYVKELDSKKWLVIVNAYYNRKNDPPLTVVDQLNQQSSFALFMSVEENHTGTNKAVFAVTCLAKNFVLRQQSQPVK